MNQFISAILLAVIALILVIILAVGCTPTQCTGSTSGNTVQQTCTHS